MQPCEIIVDTSADPPLLRISGRLSADAVEDDLAPEVAALMKSPPPRLLVDLSSLTFIGSLGIGQILMLCGRVAEAGGGAAIIAEQPGVREAFERCRAEDTVTVCRSADEAGKVFAARRGPGGEPR